MSSIIDKIKRGLGMIVTPVFGVDDTPPTLEDGDSRPGRLDKTTGGILVHVANAAEIGGGGGGGDASAANQVSALNALDSIYDALQTLGLESTSQDIFAAVQSLGGGASMADLATALLPLAGASTELTQQDILAALEAQGIDLAQVRSDIALLVPDLDAVRVACEAINTKTPASPAQDRATAAAPSATRASNGSAFIDVALDATVAAVTTAVNAAKAVLDTIYVRLADGNQITVARGNVADGSAAALPITIGAVDTGGLSRRLAGEQVGSQMHLYVKATNNVAVQAPSGGALALNSTLTDGTLRCSSKTITERADGAVPAAQNETLKASGGRLFWLRVEGAAAGTYYLQLHNAASIGSIGAGTIRGLGIQISGVGDEQILNFANAPRSFSAGITYALSTTKNTYTAAAGKTAYVEAGWD